MSALTDALDRLQNLYNSGAYDVVDNPGGFDNNGHRVNFINLGRDVATAAAAAIASGDIVGPAGAADGAIALFDGATGKLVKGSGKAIGTAADANALAIGPNGLTYPALRVDTATASSATGLWIKSAAAAAGLALAVLSSGANEALTLDAKGAGTITIAGTSTGAISLGRNTIITSTTDITYPAPGYTPASGALQCQGGFSCYKAAQFLGGKVVIGDGSSSTGFSGQNVIFFNGYNIGATTGSCIDCDDAIIQQWTLGGFGSVTNGLVSGVHDSTFTIKSNKTTGDLMRFVKHITNSSVGYALILGTDLSATVGGALNAAGDFAINTNKFNVVAASGNVGVGGLLSVTGALSAGGDFAINTNKFNVVAASGNVGIGGLLSVTSTTTLGGALTYGGVTLSNAVTGTGNMVLSAGPTFTGTITAATITASGVISTSNATASTSSTTGSGKFGGGLGVLGDIYGGGAILSTGPASGIGYATGSGGTVTQATSKSTGVTLNKITGLITMNNAALAAGASVTFLCTNSVMAGTDLVCAAVDSSYGTVGTYRVHAEGAGTGNGGFFVTLTNISGGSLSEALKVRFAIVKGANA